MDLERIKRDRGAEANFLLVYVREAHACDEWETPDNLEDGIRILQPRTAEERRAAAARLVADLGLTIPVVVDRIDDGVARTWGAWPERLYVIGADGRVLHRGGPGPFEFRPEEIPRVLDRIAPGGR